MRYTTTGRSIPCERGRIGASLWTVERSEVLIHLSQRGGPAPKQLVIPSFQVKPPQLLPSIGPFHDRTVSRPISLGTRLQMLVRTNTVGCARLS